MEFIDYLQNRHKLMKGEREIKEESARQYNNRLVNLQKHKIYNGEKYIDEQMLFKIKGHYKDTTNHYSRTIKYYIEYLNHLSRI
ncbi:hypothetical protein [Niallia oryzisoli]|uniref:hypothetical protein n=1 Tax=Niallia oryzisoli TaxID=1737571 RepID=UPI003735EDE3